MPRIWIWLAEFYGTRTRLRLYSNIGTRSADHKGCNCGTISGLMGCSLKLCLAKHSKVSLRNTCMSAYAAWTKNKQLFISLLVILGGVVIYACHSYIYCNCLEANYREPNLWAVVGQNKTLRIRCDCRGKPSNYKLVQRNFLSRHWCGYWCGDWRTHAEISRSTDCTISLRFHKPNNRNNQNKRTSMWRINKLK